MTATTKMQCRSWCKLTPSGERIGCQLQQGHGGKHLGRRMDIDIPVRWPKRTERAA